MSTLGMNMKHLREFHNLTQKFVGELIGVDQSVYSRYETGPLRPSDEQLSKLAAYYKVPEEMLTGNNGLTLHMPNANGTQVANGQHVNQQQHVVSEEFVKQMLEQYATVMKDMQQLVQVVAQTNERSMQLMEILAKQRKD
jgi:transcriptional regulator with XRE-family HTH domain